MRKFFGVVALLATLIQPAHAMQESTIDINQQGSLEQAMLHQAINASNAPLVKGLLDRYPMIDVNTWYNNGASLFERSMHVDSPEIMNLILKHPKFVIDPNLLGHCLIYAIILSGKYKDYEYEKSSYVKYVKIAEMLARHEKTNIHYVDPFFKHTASTISILTKCLPVVQELIDRKDIYRKHIETMVQLTIKSHSFGNDDEALSILLLLNHAHNKAKL